MWSFANRLVFFFFPLFFLPGHFFFLFDCFGFLGFLNLLYLRFRFFFLCYFTCFFWVFYLLLDGFFNALFAYVR